MRNEVTYTFHIEHEQEGGFWGYFPSLPGCFTQGETLEEVVFMAKDALAGYLECLLAHGDPIPLEKPRSERMVLDLPISASIAR